VNKEIKGTKGKKGSKYPPEIRTQAFEMYHNCRGEYTSNVIAARHIANLLGVTSFDTILNWVKQDQIDKKGECGQKLRHKGGPHMAYSHEEKEKATIHRSTLFISGLCELWINII